MQSFQPSPGPAQPSPAPAQQSSPAQPTSRAQSSPAHPPKPSPAQASPSLSVGLAKAFTKHFLLPDSDVAFLARFFGAQQSGEAKRCCAVVAHACGHLYADANLESADPGPSWGWRLRRMAITLLRKPRLWPIPNSKTVLCTCGLSPLPAQPSPPRRPGQCSPAFPAHSSERSPPHPPAASAQPSPSLGVGLAKALPKAFSYRIQMLRSRPPERSVFGPFLAGLGPPCRCVSPFWNVGFGTSFCCFPGLFSVPVAQPSPAHHAGQVSPAQLSTGPPNGKAKPAQPKPWRGRCQSFAKGFFLPDSDVAFSAAGTLRFWSVFGRFGAAVPLRFAVLERWFWDLFLLLPRPVLCSCGPAQPSLAQPTTQARSVACPAQPSQPTKKARSHSSERSHQQPAQPSPAQALVWALPKLCQRLFLTGFRCCVLGRRNAPFLVRFWPVWGRRAAAFRRFGTLVLGPLFAASQGCSLFLWPSQPSPAQPSLPRRPGQPSPA